MEYSKLKYFKLKESEKQVLWKTEFENDHDVKMTDSTSSTQRVAALLCEQWSSRLPFTVYLVVSVEKKTRRSKTQRESRERARDRETVVRLRLRSF
jgi:hypothetical protein